MVISEQVLGFRASVFMPQVWQKVTDFTAQDWRSDLTHVERLSDRSFMELAKNGTKTEFEISLIQPNQRLELQFENDYVSGQSIGLFSNQGAQTTLDFTELVRCKRWWHAATIHA